MPHTYTRHCYRASDGKRFSETLSIEPAMVAMQMGGYNRSGNRADFLELLNRWNRAGSGNDSYFYTYVAE